ncbi:MAG: shikimate dehydrogenase [Oscillatoriales cyanobacterium C42_A2020_001]|nr:shikimate dehydrogenase [Leptolyngbyaceae cyanobacterium C42_A2020_001]
MITGTTKLLGVIGHPIEHSLSPTMHNAAIAQLGVDYVYLPFPVKPEDLSQALVGFGAIGVQGFNVTIPHKQSIMRLLSDISPLAQAVGAVNTVWRGETGWHGTNTDVAGFLAPLRSLKSDWSQTEALILGIGGAARAVVAGCAELGCASVRVVGRDRAKLAHFQDSWAHSALVVHLQTHLWEALPNLLPTAGLIVNTTPIGMYPNVEQSPISLEQLLHLRPGAIAYDLIYTPSPTLFLQYAAHYGATTLDGSEMLVQQGAAALEQWLDQAIPVDVMRRSLHQHLKL